MYKEIEIDEFRDADSIQILFRITSDNLLGEARYFRRRETQGVSEGVEAG